MSILGAILLTGYLGGATAAHFAPALLYLEPRFRSFSACLHGLGFISANNACEDWSQYATSAKKISAICLDALR